MSNGSNTSQGSEKKTKKDRLREQGKSRDKALSTYAEKMKGLTPQEKQIHRLNTAAKLVANSISFGGLPDVHPATKQLLKLQNYIQETINFFETGLEPHEFSAKVLWPGDLVVLKGKHKKDSDYYPFSGKVLKIKFTDEDSTTVKLGRKEIEVPTSLLRRHIPE